MNYLKEIKKTNNYLLPKLQKTIVLIFILSFVVWIAEDSLKITISNFDIGTPKIIKEHFEPVKKETKKERVCAKSVGSIFYSCLFYQNKVVGHYYYYTDAYGKERKIYVNKKYRNDEDYLMDIVLDEANKIFKSEISELLGETFYQHREYYSYPTRTIDISFTVKKGTQLKLNKYKLNDYKDNIQVDIKIMYKGLQYNYLFLSHLISMNLVNNLNQGTKINIEYSLNNLKENYKDWYINTRFYEEEEPDDLYEYVTYSFKYNFD